METSRKHAEREVDQRCSGLLGTRGGWSLAAYSHGHPVSRNQPKQSSKQEGILGIHIRSRSEPRAAYCPGQIIGRVPAYCVVLLFVGKRLGTRQFFFPPHDLDTKSTVPVLTLSLLYKHFRTTEL